MFSPKSDQIKAFEAHIEASIRLGKPLFLHCRDAFDDFRAILAQAAKAGACGVVHCFTDGPAEAMAHLELGFDIGVTGWVADPARGASLRDALAHVPMDRLHLETDAPYLRPKNAPKSREPNEPSLLPWVARAVAEIKGVAPDALASAASANSRRLFSLPTPDLPTP